MSLQFQELRLVVSILSYLDYPNGQIFAPINKKTYDTVIDDYIGVKRSKIYFVPKKAINWFSNYVKNMNSFVLVTLMSIT